MKELFKKNFAIILAFLLPIALIAIVALSTYLPSVFLSTDYNFLYASCSPGSPSRYYCNDYLQRRFSVVNGRLVVNVIDPSQDLDRNRVPDINDNYSARIFFHDTKKNESQEITLKEAQTLSLHSLLTSPDGVTVSSNYDKGSEFFFIFNGHTSYGFYLTKGKSKAKLNLINHNDQYYYRDNFHFIGWVLSEKN